MPAVTRCKSYVTRAILFLFALALLISGGCSSVNLSEFYFGDLFGSKSKSIVDKGPDQLAVEGMQKMRAKDYEEALKAFKQLKERYPYSKYTILAELKIGDAYFYDKKYNEASMAYEEFARLHPRNEVVPYVLYQIGMCHFLTFTSTDRDPEETQASMQAFQRLIQAYPKSDYSHKAKKQLFECQKRYVAHEFHVGRFYLRTENYLSARTRLTKLKTDFGPAIEALGYDKQIDKMLAECEKGIAKGPKKPSIWYRIGF